MRKPILCVDFDGVIHSYESGWKGADVIPDAPIPGAFKFLASAVNFFRVMIYSSRSSQPGGIDAMKDWFCVQTEIGFHDKPAWIDQIEFPTQKPVAFLTIDDRAICFNGDWSSLDPEMLLQFKPWNKR